MSALTRRYGIDPDTSFRAAVNPPPRDESEAALWLQRDELLRSPRSESGYVSVGARHFHVHATPLGPIVSALRWRPTDTSLQPVHDLFSVTGPDKQLAIHAWGVLRDNRFKRQGEPAQPAAIGDPHDDADGVRQQDTPRRRARSGTTR